jgi:hypothetical protein
MTPTNPRNWPSPSEYATGNRLLPLIRTPDPRPTPLGLYWAILMGAFVALGCWALNL